MKPFWIGVGIFCVVVAVMIVAIAPTPHAPSEAARIHLLGIIDEALSEAMEDTPNFKIDCYEC